MTTAQTTDLIAQHKRMDDLFNDGFITESGYIDYCKQYGLPIPAGVDIRNQDERVLDMYANGYITLQDVVDYAVRMSARMSA